jgi:hypothetical protein
VEKAVAGLRKKLGKSLEENKLLRRASNGTQILDFFVGRDIVGVRN